MHWLISGLALSFIAVSTHANTINVPGNYTLIQDALDASKNGDLNGDGEVGPEDLALILGAWGVCP